MILQDVDGEVFRDVTELDCSVKTLVSEALGDFPMWECIITHEKGTISEPHYCSEIKYGNDVEGDFTHSDDLQKWSVRFNPNQRIWCVGEEGAFLNCYVYQGGTLEDFLEEFGEGNE